MWVCLVLFKCIIRFFLTQPTPIHTAMKVYFNRTPRSLALVEGDSVLVIRYTQNSSNEKDHGSSSPKCIIEFVKRSSISFESKYRLLCPYECQGCLGLIEVGSEVFLCVINKDAMVARPRPGETVNRINAVEFYSLNSEAWDFLTLDMNGYTTDFNISLAGSSVMDSSSRGNIGIEHPCAAIRKLLSNGSFYYSSNFDVATVLQYRGGSGVAKQALSLEMADRSFMWNSFMIEGLISFRSRLGDTQRQELDDCHFLTTVIRGFAESKDVKISGFEKPGTLTIISRQSWLRAGTRFNARGVDDEGNVANFVETETIFSWGEAAFGFTQVRGSIPVFWEQDANLMSAKISITRSVEAAQPAFNKHFEHLIAKFGIVHIVNLLSNKAGEAELTARYHEHLKAAKDLRGNLGMTDFDFHAEVAKGGYAMISRIFPYIDPAFENIKFYALDPQNPDTKMEQSGVFRTNCLDCLDRTNFVQQLISKYALEAFFMLYKVNPGQDIWTKHNFLWADNGDQLSQIYAGTNALKTSFTRSGKMNFAGALADVTKSVSRMYINSFVDKGRQNTMDVLLGRTEGQRRVVLFDPINDYVTIELKRRASEFSSNRNIKVFAGTFNLNGVVCQQDLSDWLFPEDGGKDVPDIVLVGFQEIVELTPSQILNAEVGKREFWEKEVAATLNSRDDYVLVRSEQLVGSALMMFVRSSEVSYISRVEGSMIKTGLGGMAGNKGGVAVSFYFADTSFCFITAHLAAGSNNLDERHHNFKTISTGLVFSRGRRIKSHDSIIWLGDFNYRVDLPYDLVKERIQHGDLDTLFEHDQLNRQMVLGETFPFYNEMPIKFPPTYKFDNDSNVYDTSEKMRTPSWTDRILSRGSNLKQTSYGCVPDIMFSDHRPVYATFTATVVVVDHEIKKRLFKQLYDRRQSEVGDANDLVSLININETTLTHGLPPPSSDSKKWWISPGQPAKVPFPAPPGYKINPDRNPNPFVPDTDFVKSATAPKANATKTTATPSTQTAQPSPASTTSAVTSTAAKKPISKASTMPAQSSSQITSTTGSKPSSNSSTSSQKPAALGSKPTTISKSNNLPPKSNIPSTGVAAVSTNSNASTTAKKASPDTKSALGAPPKSKSSTDTSLSLPSTRQSSGDVLNSTASAAITATKPQQPTSKPPIDNGSDNEGALSSKSSSSPSPSAPVALPTRLDLKENANGLASNGKTSGVSTPGSSIENNAEVEQNQQNEIKKENVSEKLLTLPESVAPTDTIYKETSTGGSVLQPLKPTK